MFVYPAAVGMVLGLFYYGSLWLVLQRLTQISRPAIWMGLSFLARTLALVLVLYLLFADSWQQLLVAVLGMLAMRTVLVQRIKPADDHADGHRGRAR